MNTNKQTSFSYSDAKSKSIAWNEYVNEFNSKKFIPNFSVAYLDAKSKSIVWAAYAEHFAGEEIQKEGFNLNSGNVYIALENGVTIASAFGQSVEFYVYDFDNDDELGFDSIEELNEYLGTRY